MEYSTLSTVALTLGLFALVCLTAGCLIRHCCPFWISEKIGMFRERVYQTELHNFSKSPSLFSCNMMGRSHPTHINIPIVIVSDENGKRVMGGKDAHCVYEKQDMEEIL
ncbi:uncharacterized protein LOC118439305 [Folsomia candida]|uniref:Uncharacterized protein n=1 Tax=Folsomia candida TaxID=158441 RepID=A0A226D4Y4_FOLCA|nr:uncharacterized protein LOC118439305 [Folsomia candida]OXA40615.1 hypothetical protein Fcan01_24742 [Folsomia candida]